MADDNGKAGGEPGSTGAAAGGTEAGNAAVDEAKIASIVEKHGGDANKVATELAGFYASHGTNTQTISELRKKIEKLEGGNGDQANIEQALIDEMRGGVELNVKFARDQANERFQAEKGKLDYYPIIAPTMAKLCREDPEIRSMLERLEKIKNPIEAGREQTKIWERVFVKAMEQDMSKVIEARQSGKLPVSERSGTTSRDSGGGSDHPIKKLLKEHSAEASAPGI